MNKKIKLALVSYLVAMQAVAQQAPTNNNPGGSGSRFNSGEYWSRGGNFDQNGINNIFGTLWNSPIYTRIPLRWICTAQAETKLIPPITF